MARDNGAHSFRPVAVDTTLTAGQHRSTRTAPLQEDAHVALLDLDGHSDRAFFGVFDGHGGAQVAKFCAKYMPKLFLGSEEYKKGDIQQALISAYLEIDEMLRKPEHAEELNKLKAKSSNNNGIGLEAVDQQEPVGSGAYHLHQQEEWCLCECWRPLVKSKQSTSIHVHCHQRHCAKVTTQDHATCLQAPIMMAQQQGARQWWR
jgi:hypothetical protein